MRRVNMILSAAILIATAAEAEFVIIKNDTDKTHINVTENAQYDPVAKTLGGVPVEEISCVRRSISTSLNDVYISGYYPGGKSMAKDGSANYYLAISDCEAAFDEDGMLIPSEPGGVVMMFDIYGADSEDADNAVIPEGDYPLNETLESGTAYSSLTFARYLGYDGEIEYAIAKSGIVSVRHAAEGGYQIKGDIETWEGEKFTVTYDGEIEFDNMGGSSSQDYLMTEDVEETTFTGVTATAYGGDADYHRFGLQMYDTTADTSGGLISDGIVLNVDLFVTAPENDEIVIPEGHYVVTVDYEEIESFEPWTFMAGDVYTLMGYPLQVGTYVQDLRHASDEQVIRYGYINGGTFDVTRDGDKYSFQVDMTTRNGIHITGTYPLGDMDIVDKRPAVPEGDWISTLRDDFTFGWSEDTFGYAHYSETYRDPDWNYYTNVDEFTLTVDDNINRDSFHLNLLVPAGTKSPEGTYTVADTSEGSYEPYTYIPGWLDYAVMRGTWGWERDDPETMETIGQAPATEGTITITKLDSGEYHILFELKDDADPKHTIKADWAGEIHDPQSTWTDTGSE